MIIQTAIQNGINAGNYFSPSMDKQSQARLIVDEITYTLSNFNVAVILSHAL